MKITDKLLELGFGLKEDYYANQVYLFRTSREDRNRFVHDFVYYEDENQFYINCHKMSGTTTITEKDLINDHNECNTPAKEKWLEIKEALQDFDFTIYGRID